MHRVGGQRLTILSVGEFVCVQMGVNGGVGRTCVGPACVCVRTGRGRGLLSPWVQDS